MLKKSVLFIICVLFFSFYSAFAASDIFAVEDGLHTLHLFCINSSSRLVYLTEADTGENWTAAELLHTNVNSAAAAKNSDGNLLLFFSDNSGKIFSRYYDCTSGRWSAEKTFASGTAVSDIIKDESGSLHLFYISGNSILNYSRKTSSAEWSKPIAVCSAVSDAASAVNADGRLEVFLTGKDKVLRHIYQLKPGGNWSEVQSFNVKASRISTARNRDGRIELFYAAPDLRLYHIWQLAANGSWSSPGLFAASGKTVCAGVNSDGRIEVFYTDCENILHHNWQYAPSSGWGQSAQFGWEAVSAVPVLRYSGLLQVIYINSSDEIYYRSQIESGRFWTSEYPLPVPGKRPFNFQAGPPVKIWTPDKAGWHLNDHCFIKSENGWEIFSIYAPDPGTSTEEFINWFGHAGSDSLTSGWKELLPVFRDFLNPGDVLWAPHIIYNDRLYYMFYCGGGNPQQFSICVRTSKDLKSWSDRKILFREGYEARDPMVLYIEQEKIWVMYYCTTRETSGGRHIVACRTSSDLINWSERKTVYTDLHHGQGYGPTESPFVVYKDGWYYLFIGPRPYDAPSAYVPNWEHPGYDGTDIFRSEDPESWDNSDYIGHLEAHAAEIIQDSDGQWYYSHSGIFRNGLYLGRLNWPE